MSEPPRKFHPLERHTDPNAPPPEPKTRYQIFVDDLPPPYLTYTLIALNVAIYAAVYLGIQLEMAWVPALYDFGMVNRLGVLNGETYRLLTSMFLHLGLDHILFNAYSLYVLGREMEQEYGWRAFLVVYFLSGLAGGIAYVLLDTGSAAGASGAIFGLAGARFWYFYRYRHLLGEMGRGAIIHYLVILGGQLVLGFTGRWNVANSAHIGGLVMGVLLALIISPTLSEHGRKQDEHGNTIIALYSQPSPLRWDIMLFVLFGLAGVLLVGLLILR